MYFTYGPGGGGTLASTEPHETVTAARNYPNPFNAGTVISFSLAETAPVSVDVYDVLGRHITTLASELFDAGDHEVSWDGRNDSGESVATGIYFYRVSAPSGSTVRKMMLMK